MTENSLPAKFIDDPVDGNSIPVHRHERISQKNCKKIYKEKKFFLINRKNCLQIAARKKLNGCEVTSSR